MIHVFTLLIILGNFSFPFITHKQQFQPEYFLASDSILDNKDELLLYSHRHKNANKSINLLKNKYCYHQTAQYFTATNNTDYNNLFLDMSISLFVQFIIEN